MSELAFEVPFWDSYQWGRFTEQDEQAQAAIVSGERKIYSFPQFATEVFHRLYSWDAQPIEKPKPEAQWAVKLHGELGQNSEFQELQELVGGNYWLAGQAATSFLEELAQALPRPKEELKDPQELRQQVLGLKRAGADAEAQELVEEGKKAVEALREWAEGLGDQAEAISFAARYAATEAKEMQEMMEAFSWDLATGRSGTPGSLEDKIRLRNELSTNFKLQDIAWQAGRMKRLAEVKQQSKSKQAHHTIKSVETGANLARLLPSQALMLKEPELQPLFIKGYAEQSLLQYEMGGKDRLGQGPIVIVLDSTGSMDGEREIWSKAVTLALVGIATTQKRHCRIIHYGAKARRIDDFAPGEEDSAKLLQSMDYFYGDAVNWEPASLDAAVECIETQKNFKDADIVFITDGGWGDGSGKYGSDSAAWSKGFQQKRKQLEFSIYTILIGSEYTTEIDQFVAPDKLIKLGNLKNDEAVQQVFEI